MSDNQSFCGRRWVMHKAVSDGSLVEEFIASDAVHGQIVNDTKKKVQFGTAIIFWGALCAYVWMEPNRYFKGVVVGIAAVVMVKLVPLVIEFGIHSYMLRNLDRMAAYVKFNEWLQTKA